jgi:multidrug efflux pump subunit AcrB
MLARIKGIKSISSTSGNGWGNIQLDLDKHTNVDAARFEAAFSWIWISIPMWMLLVLRLPPL